LQDPPKLTQIGIFGLKICHLATLSPSPPFLWPNKKAETAPRILHHDTFPQKSHTFPEVNVPLPSVTGLPDDIFPDQNRYLGKF
jgi:hypothetical protein